MKFERRFELNQDPRWASFYLDYKSIKTLIKLKARRHGTSIDLEGENQLFGIDNVTECATRDSKCFQ